MCAEKQTGVELQDAVELGYDFRNAFNNILKQPINGIGWHTGIRERYKNGGLTIHLHFEFTDDVTCVNLQAVLDSDSNQDILSPLTNGGEAHWPGGLNFGTDQTRESVFVAVYDLMQEPQRLIPTVIRLRTLNSLNDRCGNLSIRETIQPIGQSFVPPLLGKGEGCDFPIVGIREVNGWVKMAGCDFPHDVVQGGASVCNAIANDASEWVGRVGLCPFEQRGLERLVCLLKDESAELSFFVAPGHQLKTAQVLICPDDFEPCSV